MVADLETPVAAYLKLADGEDFSFLLESVEDGDIGGRYSIIGLQPDLLFRVENGQPQINRRAALAADDFDPMDAAPLDALRMILAETRLDIPEILPPMSAGLFGYMAYDMVRFMEDLPDTNPDVLGVPDGLFIRPTVIAVFDSIAHKVMLVTPVRPAAPDSKGDNAAAAYEKAEARLSAAYDKMHGSLPEPELTPPNEMAEPVSNMSQQAILTWWRNPKPILRRAIFFRLWSASVFRFPSPCRHLICIVPCGGSIRHPICSSSICATLRLSAPARKCWSA